MRSNEWKRNVNRIRRSNVSNKESANSKRKYGVWNVSPSTSSRLIVIAGAVVYLLFIVSLVWNATGK